MFYNANSLFAFGLILDMSNEIYYVDDFVIYMQMVLLFFSFVFIFICLEVSTMVFYLSKTIFMNIRFYYLSINDCNSFYGI